MVQELRAFVRYRKLTELRRILFPSILNAYLAESTTTVITDDGCC